MSDIRFVRDAVVLDDLASVVSTLASGEELALRDHDHGVAVVREYVIFDVKKGAQYGDPGFWVHGSPAYSLDQVLDFLNGDAHDVSKVQWFNGHHFFSLVSDPNRFAG